MALPKRGIDISEFNGSVDIAALQGQVDFVIIRCGYGSDYANQDDPQFEANVKKCQAAGIPWGTYLYSYAKTKAMAQSEAAHTLRLLQGRRPPYGVWYDVEDSQIAGADLVATCQTFCAAMEAAGLYAGIYASLSWLTTKLNSPQLDPYDKWVAQWNSACTYPKPYGIWQYTDRLAIGVQVFDGNWAYKDYPAIIQAMGSQQEGASLTEADVRKLARQEMEAYFAELAKKPVSPWAQAAVESVLARGLMRGDADGSFRPQSFITRQEVAAVLENLS